MPSQGWAGLGGPGWAGWCRRTAKISQWIRQSLQVFAIRAEIKFYRSMLRGDHKLCVSTRARSIAAILASRRRGSLSLTLEMTLAITLAVSLFGGVVVAEALSGVAAVPEVSASGATRAAAGTAVNAAANASVNPMVPVAIEPKESFAASAESFAPFREASVRPQMTRPKARKEIVPQARWAHRPEATLWTRSALAALDDHGQPLVEMVPRDILEWCPAYPHANADQRAAFWVGFMSALTKHESTYKPHAVGGGGLWYGLLQILPSTARLYNCRARSGAALKNGSANLSCAIRIMARTVPRDGVIHAYTKGKKRRWRGVTADWGPMRSETKRRDMARWLKAQSYCKPLASIRPQERPEGLGVKREG